MSNQSTYWKGQPYLTYEAHVSWTHFTSRFHFGNMILQCNILRYFPLTVIVWFQINTTLQLPWKPSSKLLEIALISENPRSIWFYLYVDIVDLLFLGKAYISYIHLNNPISCKYLTYLNAEILMWAFRGIVEPLFHNSINLLCLVCKLYIDKCINASNLL